MNFGAFAILRVLAVPTVACAALAFAAACQHGLTWHARITFSTRVPSRHWRWLRFVVLSLVTLGVNLCVLSSLEAAGVVPLLAQAGAVAAASPLNYLGSRFWVFSEEPGHRKPRVV